jgi:hypothetical protein
MPFIIALQGDPQPMYFQAQPDGTMLLTPNREKATRFPEERADMLVAAHNIYTTAETAALVEGAREAPEAVAS